MSENTISMKLDEKSLDHIQKLDASLRQHSIQHTEASVFAQKLLQTVMTLEEAKVSYITEFLKKNGVDTNRVVNAVVNKTGELLIQLGPAENSPANGSGSSEEKPSQPAENTQ